MPSRTKLKGVSVYANKGDRQALKRAADMENRTVSNYLLNLGLKRAKELGIAVASDRSEV